MKIIRIVAGLYILILFLFLVFCYRIAVKKRELIPDGYISEFHIANETNNPDKKLYILAYEFEDLESAQKVKRSIENDK